MLMRFLLGLLFVIALSSPSYAIIRAMQTHPDAAELKQGCEANGGSFGFSGDGKGYGCSKANCDGKGHGCVISCDLEANCQSGTPSKTIPGFDFAFAAGPIKTFGMDKVSEPRLASTCKLMPGAIFGTDKGSVYFCVNPNCQDHQTCSIECRDGKCTASMPEKPTVGLTILGILQGGDKVNHRTTTPEPDSTKNNNAPDAPSETSPPEPSGPIIG